MLSKYQRRPAVTALSALVLTACGGGGGSTAPTVQTLTIEGTAAVGAALGNGAVEAKCAAGTGTAVTAQNGTYTVSVSGGQLPCVLRVTSGATVLHSMVESGLGATAVANITPLTELLVASIAAANPASVFSSFDAAAQAKLTTQAVSAAKSAILATLAGTVDLQGVDPLKDPLVAATPGSAGNKQDQLLDALGAALAQAQTPLSSLSEAVAAPAAGPAPQVILAPRAASCAALRSGKYRVINPHERGHDADFVSHLVTVDAVKLTLASDVEPSSSAVQLNVTTGVPCQFSFQGDHGVETVLVSTGGVLVVRSPSPSGGSRTSFMVPGQEVPLEKLAGNWVGLFYDQTNNPPIAHLTELTVGSAGQLNFKTFCEGLACESMPGFQASALTAHAKGGYKYSYVDNASQGSSRVFAFRALDGTVSMIEVDDRIDGGVGVFARQEALSLPAVGSVSKYWDYTAGTGGFTWSPSAPVGATAVVDRSMTVTSVDPAAGSYTRLWADQRVDTFFVNKPLQGVRYRPASSGPNGTVSEVITLPLPGAGLWLYGNVSPSLNMLGVSVAHD